jgi:hypothetical protein
MLDGGQDKYSVIRLREQGVSDDALHKNLGLGRDF